MTVEEFMKEWLPVLVSLTALLLSAYNSTKGNKKTDEKEIAERIARETRADMKLDEINKDTKEIKETVKSIQSDIKDHEGRIVKLEASLKALHKRLDMERKEGAEIHEQ